MAEPTDVRVTELPSVAVETVAQGVQALWQLNEIANGIGMALASGFSNVTQAISYAGSGGSGGDGCQCAPELQAIADGLTVLADVADQAGAGTAAALAPVAEIAQTLAGFDAGGALSIAGTADVPQLDVFADLLTRLRTALTSAMATKDNPNGPSTFAEILSAALTQFAQEATLGKGKDLTGTLLQAHTQADAEARAPSPDGHSFAWGGIVGKLVQWATGAQDVSPLTVIEAVAGPLTTQNLADAVQGKGVLVKIGSYLLARLQDTVLPQDCKPDSAWKNCLRAYGYASALGFLAHIISGLSQVEVGGIKPPNLAGVARLVGQLAAFAPLGNVVAGTFYKVFCAEPLRQFLQRYGRPTLPGVGPVMEWYTKGFFGGRSDVDLPHDAPMTWRQALECGGLDDAWIDMTAAAAFRDPSRREIMQDIQGQERTDEWLTAKLRDLRYDPAEIPDLIFSMRRQARRPQLNQCLSALQSMAGKGIIGLGEFRARAAGLGFPMDIVNTAADAADIQLERSNLEDAVQVTLEQYKRGQIDDGAMENTLGALLSNGTAAALAAAIAKVQRYHVVWFLTPSEKAKEALPTYREALRKGLVTASEYENLLTTAGVAYDMVRLLVSLGEAARKDEVWAKFRSLGLGAYRDAVAHGMMSLPDYRKQLVDHGMPSEYVDVEVGYAKALLERRTESEVASRIIPPLKAAYIHGLIGWDTLSQAFVDAGWLGSQIAAQGIELEYRRELEEQRLAEREAAEAEKLRREAEREEEKRKRELERKRAAEQKQAEALEKERQARAAAAVKALAAATVALLKVKDAGSNASVQALLQQIEAAYIKAGLLLPDVLYFLTEAITDESARPGGPDLEVLSFLVADLDAQLGKLARMPNPTAAAPAAGQPSPYAVGIAPSAAPAGPAPGGTPTAYSIGLG